MTDETGQTAAAETPPATTGTIDQAPPPVDNPAPRANPDGTDFIDFKALGLAPEVAAQVEARFSRIYGHAKQSTAEAREAKEAIRLLAEQNQRLEQRINLREATQDTDRARDMLSDLRTQKIKAMETANYPEVARIDEQIAVLAPRIAEATLRVNAPPMAHQPAASQQGGLSSEEVNTVTRWASQVDQNGQFVRPWALPNHPQHRATLEKLQEISREPEFENVAIETVLRETDRRMTGRRPMNGGNGVLTGTQTRPPANQTARLTPNQMMVAEKMFIRAGLAKTPAEAHKKYAEQLKGMGA